MATLLPSARSANAISSGEFLATSGLVLPKTTGYGIKIDTTTPTFGWKDLLGNVTTKGSGVNNPTWTAYRGNISQYLFDVNSEAWAEYHIPHDYLEGSDIHIHTHWSHNVTTVTGGSVTLGWDVSYAKGYDQAAFSAPINTTLVSNASTTQYQHIIGEIQLSAASPSGSQIATGNLQIDGVILVRAYLSANNITVSGGGVPKVFFHYVDIHYQSTQAATKTRNHPFYT